MNRSASAAVPGSSSKPSSTSQTGPPSWRSSAADSSSDAYSGEPSSEHRGAWRGGRGASTSRASGKGDLLGAVGVAGMRGPGDSIPRQCFGQRVFESRRLEAKLLPCPLDDVAGMAAWMGSVGARPFRELGERDRVDPLLHTQGASDASDQVVQVDVFERGVVGTMRSRFAKVARERAREADVLHPGEVGGPLVCLLGNRSGPPSATRWM